MTQLRPRQLEIMQNLAKMLGSKGPVKVTTALLASECSITEAALYRHFPSKRKIYSGLVDFCEKNLFELISNINSSGEENLIKTKKILVVLVTFCEKNPGLARLLTREAFSVDETSLDERIKLLMSKIELQIKQNLQKFEQVSKKKLGLTTASSANLLFACAEGLIQQYVRSGFEDLPTKRANEQFDFLIKSLNN
jgi:TetR/AcrR family transcriptional regulator